MRIRRFVGGGWKRGIATVALLAAGGFLRPALPAEAVQFGPLTNLLTGLPSPARLAYGPDGCLYAAYAFAGSVGRICFDANKVVLSNTIVVPGLGGGGGVNALLGMGFDPDSDPGGEIHLYLSYSITNGAPFNGRVARAVSTDGGVSYSVDENFITGLPRMNESHQTNGVDFGSDGCLYIAQGNRSNAGYDAAFAASALSGAIVSVCFKDGGGNVDPSFDRDCGDGNTQEACDLEVYAAGLRNPFDLVWHSNGRLYNTDNDANVGFRESCPNVSNTFGCPCQSVTVSPIGDELNLIEQGKYYGSPNPYRANPSGLQCQGGSSGTDACTTNANCGGGGACEDLSALCTDALCGDPIQCFYYANGVPPPSPAEDPGGIYRAPIAEVPALLDGLAEYAAPFENLGLGTFCADWSGNLLTSGGPGPAQRFVLSSDGLSATYAGAGNLNGATGLDVVVGPDGTVYMANFNGASVTYLEPVAQPNLFAANYFEDGNSCGTCGDNLAEIGEQCDGTDDAACPGLCLGDCTCDFGPPGPGGLLVEFRADTADGAGPYPIPGTGSPWVDLAGNFHDGTLFNFAGDANSGWQGDGTVGNPYRLQYDGTNDQRVTIPASSIPELNPINPTFGVTMATWFETSPSAGSPPASGDREIVVEWVELFANPYPAMSASYVNGNLQIWDCPDSGGWVTVAPVAGGTWYHLAMVKVGTDVTVYLDGAPVYTNTTSTCLGDQVSEIGIGAGVSSGVGVYAREMSGAIAQFLLIGTALDAADVLAEFQADVGLYYPATCGNDVGEPGEECDGIDDAACPGLCLSNCTCPAPAGKVVQFRADDATGTGGPHPVPGAASPWADLTGNGHDGTLFNFAGDASSGWQGDGTVADPYRLEFDGGGDQRVTIPAGSVPELNQTPTQPHTMTAWFKTSPTAGTPPANGDREMVVEWVEQFSSPFPATSVTYLNGNLEFWDCTGSWINTGAALAGDTWYHLAVAKGPAPTEVHVYLDGSEVYVNLASTCLEKQVSEIGIGAGVASAGSYSREMSGAIAQFCVFNTALDATAVAAEFAADAALYGASCVPTAEVCDGVDNDCDGNVDEDLGQTTCGLGICEVTTANCIGGVPQSCTPGPPDAEICDGVDNNCDGVIDDLGQTTCGLGICEVTTDNCVGGVPQTCTPGPPDTEICDGVDNDCDGATDDLGQTTCGLGICEVTTENCIGGASQTCIPGIPGIETCNGFDDDCDGTVDDGNPGSGGACTTGLLGVCSDGTYQCQGGALVCLGSSPSSEICDGQDNNCDGIVDEGCCGNGQLDFGETCDDSNTSDGDCCSSTCQADAAGTSCDDGNTCTGTDQCDGLGTCGGNCQVGTTCGNACLSNMTCQEPVPGTCECTLL
jgi:glucose/arabinose dehydrogenase